MMPAAHRVEGPATNAAKKKTRLRSTLTNPSIPAHTSALSFHNWPVRANQRNGLADRFADDSTLEFSLIAWKC
jgi:hypothetical protein